MAWQAHGDPHTPHWQACDPTQGSPHLTQVEMAFPPSGEGVAHRTNFTGERTCHLSVPSCLFQAALTKRQLIFALPFMVTRIDLRLAVCIMHTVPPTSEGTGTERQGWGGQVPGTREKVQQCAISFVLCFSNQTGSLLRQSTVTLSFRGPEAILNIFQNSTWALR